MIHLGFAQHKIYIIVGFGKTGQSAAQALRAGGGHVYIQDDNPQAVQMARARGFAIYDDHVIDWSALAALVLSPGIPTRCDQPHFLSVIANQYGVPVICDIDLLAQAYPTATYYGITGTNGKSTTASLLYHQLKLHSSNIYLGGNIGHPVLEFNITTSDPVFVLELSSFQLERTPNLKITTVIWLNITPDHLERHGTLEAYVAAKENIFLLPGVKQNIVISTDDLSSRQAFKKYTQDAAKTVVAIPPLDFAISQHPQLKGIHNQQNIMAVSAALAINGLTFDDDRYLEFRGLTHRQEHVITDHDVTYINDSKATNFDATRTLLMTYDRLHLILGGIPKAGGITGIEAYRDKIIHCYLIGQAQQAFSQYLRDHSIPSTCCNTLNNAVHQARYQAQPGDIVVLSPACASYDQFKNFEHRGTVFKELVINLTNQNNGSI